MNLDVRKSYQPSAVIPIAVGRQVESRKSRAEDGPFRLPSAVCRLTYCLLLIVYCLLILAGCDETFQPLKENENAPFSMYGYLDASADTQWMRITPVREQLAMPSVKPAMKVTLEDMESGTTVLLNDSLFQLPNGINYLNAWTTAEIRPERTYRLEAELPDAPVNRESSVTVTIPEDFPLPTLRENGGGCTANLRINGVDRLADVKSVWHIRFFFSGRRDDRFFTIPYRNKAYRETDGSYSVSIDTYEEMKQIEDQSVATPDSSRIIYRRLFVASGGPEWIEDIASIDDLVYALPEGLSNVENGVGYVIGIVSKTIQYESCF